MKQLMQLIGFIAILGIFMVGCDGVVDSVGEADIPELPGFSGIQSVNNDGIVTLYAGRNIDVGTVTVTNDGVTLHVKYETQNGWCINETHLHVGESLDDFPFAGRSGNPVPGRFDYKGKHNCIDEYTYEIPLGDWEEGDELIIAAHAEVKKGNKSEGAWADGTRFTPRGNWATYFTYEVVPCAPRDIDDGELTITGIGWDWVAAWLNPWGYNFAENRHSYDLTCTGDPLALQGFVDISEAALANPGDWSKFYAKFSIRDKSNKVVEVVFGNDWLGKWFELDPQPWDRIRLENNLGLTQPFQYYATVGGVVDRDMDGTFVGIGNGATIYPSDRNYFFQLIADPDANTFTLQVYGMGSSAPANPPDNWPKQNMLDEPTWLEIGSITVGAGDFNFEEVEFYTILWSSSQAGAGESSTVKWFDMQIGAPLTFDDIPGE